MERVSAMILAGGKGKRMDILCHGRPKPVLPFAGKFRVIDFTLSNCAHSGIDHVAVLTDYQRSNIANYLRRWHLMNGRPKNFHILEPGAGSYRGTADAVYQNLDHLAERRTDNVLVLAGDHIYKMDYRKMIAYHRKVGAEVTLGVISVPIEQAHRFGIVTIDSDNHVVDFVEKPRQPQSNLVSMGIYVFNRDCLERLLNEDSQIADSPHDFGYAILPRLVNGNKVFAYRFEGYWQDIGTPQAYYAANMELTLETPSFNLNHNWPILTDESNWPPPRRLEQARVVSSLVSPGCVIKGRVENSILSPGVCVEEDAVVRNSILLTNCHVGRNSVVNNSILDEDSNVGNYCFIGFGSGFKDEGDITVLGRGVKVPSRTAIGCRSKVFPDASLTDFATRSFPQGSIIVPRTAEATAGTGL